MGDVMTVADLILELECLPKYYPVQCDVSLRHSETVSCVEVKNPSDSDMGPFVLITTVEDQRNHDDNAY